MGRGLRKIVRKEENNDSDSRQQGNLFSESSHWRERPHDHNHDNFQSRIHYVNSNSYSASYNDSDSDDQFLARLKGQNANQYSKVRDNVYARPHDNDTKYPPQTDTARTQRPQVPTKDEKWLSNSDTVQPVNNTQLKRYFQDTVYDLFKVEYPHLLDERRGRSKSGQDHILDSISKLLFDQTQPMRTNIQELRDDFNQKNLAAQHAQEQYDLKVQELEQLRAQQTEKLRRTRNKYRAQIEDDKRQVTELRLKVQENEGTISTMRDSYSRLNSEFLQLKVDKEAQAQSLTSFHETETQKLLNFQEAQLQNISEEVDALKERTVAKIRELERENESKLKQAENEHATETAKLEKAQGEKLTQLAHDHEDAIKAVRDELENERTRHQLETAQMAKEFRDREVKLVEDHQRRGKRLRADVDELSAALIARDEAYLAPSLNIEIKRLDDGDIKARYVEVVQLVDNLARSQWKADQKVWTEDALQQIGFDQNQRVLKKRILQDIIWTTLHMYIFCSPFRVLGKEGKILETQWNAQCGKDPRFDNGVYTWPTPSVETERWRYVTIKECRAALTQLIPSKRDPRARLKKEFMYCVQSLRAELKASLQEIIVWKDSDTNAIDELTRKMSNVWLELGMQRYRILLSVQGARLMSSAEKLDQLVKGSLELVVVPTLGRYGSAKEGKDLDDYVIVAGCDGERFRVQQ